MNKQSGFTLIELVIVIIILGILAATAVPKFVDLQGDARASAMKGVKAALEGGATLTYSQAAIQGIEKSSSATVTKSGVNVVNGYPAATTAGIIAAVDLSANDWTVTAGGGTTALTIEASGSTATAGTCEVQYTEAVSGSRPVIEAIVTGC
ncbi:prepilin-type N-terminal cleavage/methylation domain-containing protein [Psychromonas sp.]|nr:prepilin-type N-terminal cleavage/methylation domain-containing protein [Psychromonas sp.]